MRTKLLIVIVLLIGLIVSAYSINAFSAPRNLPQAEASLDCGDFPETISDVRLVSAPANIQFAVDEAEAAAIATKDTFVSNQLPAPEMRVQFYLYSNDTVGRSETQNDDEADKNLLYQNVPAWIVTFCGLKILPIGGKDTGDANAIIPYIRQEWNTVIDARTGEIIHEFSFR